MRADGTNLTPAAFSPLPSARPLPIANPARHMACVAGRTIDRQYWRAGPVSGCDPEAVVSLATSRARGPPSDRAASRRAPRDRARPRRPPSAGRPDCRVIERLVSLTNYAEPPPASEPPAARAIRDVVRPAFPLPSRPPIIDRPARLCCGPDRNAPRRFHVGGKRGIDGSTAKSAKRAWARARNFSSAITTVKTPIFSARL